MLESGSLARVASLSGVLLALAVGPALALHLRAPQVAFDSAVLQAWMHAADAGIDVATDQLDAQQFAFTDFGCIDGSLAVFLARGRDLQVGLYDTRAGDPPPGTSTYTLLGAGSTPGWWCVAQRSPNGNLRVALLDSLGVFQGATVYPDVPADRLGLVVSGPGGTWYSEDARNGGAPHVLAFAGTGVHFGSFFMCVEPQAVTPPTLATFAGAVVRFEMLCGDPVRTSTWGRLKSIYR